MEQMNFDNIKVSDLPYSLQKECYFHIQHLTDIEECEMVLQGSKFENLDEDTIGKIADIYREVLNDEDFDYELWEYVLGICRDEMIIE